jgi:opacity protein-like surface antigen
MKFVKSIFSSFALTGCFAGIAFMAQTRLEAQTPRFQRPTVDLSFTYSAQRSNTVPGEFFWLQGGSAELSANFFQNLGVVADVSGSYAKNLAPGVDLTLVTDTFGPRYTWRHVGHHGHAVSVFGQTLIGEAHGINSVFVDPEKGAQKDWNSFALQVGGGFDIDLSKRIAIRALQADWVRTQFPNADTNVQNNMRLGAGIVIHLQR